MDTWQFYRNESDLWCWKHVELTGNATQSERCFESRTDCIADAMRNGYLTRASLLHEKPADRGFVAPWRAQHL